MKKFFKPIAVFLSAALLLTSCIDNTVSNGIEAIRQAQANLINAKAQAAEADAAYTNALAAVELANAAYIDAETESLMETVEGQDIANQEALLTLEKNAADAATYLAEAEKELEEALDALADYLATQGIEDAEAYLEDYRDAMDEVYAYAEDIADQNETIAELLKLMNDPDGDTYALFKERMERQLALRQAELAVAEEIRTEVVAAAGSSADAATLWATTEGEIQTLNNEIEALDVSITEAENVETAAADVVSDLNDVISEFEDGEAELESEQEDLDLAQDALDAAEEDKADIEAEIALLDAQLAPLTTELTAKFTGAAAFRATAVSNFQSITVAANALKVAISQGVAATITTRQTALNTAITTFEVTVGETGEDASTYATIGAVDTGLGNLEAFIDIPVDKAGSTTDYESILALYAPVAALFNVGETGYNLVQEIGKYDEDNFINDFENANGVIANMPEYAPEGLSLDLADAMDAIETETENVAEAQAVVDEIQAWITANQAAYDAAVAALPAAEEAEEAAEDAIDALEDEQGVLQFELGLKQDLADALESFVEDDVNMDVETWETEVENAKIEVAEAQEDIDQIDRDVAHATEMIAREQAELTVLETELASWQELAAQYLALMNAAIGG